MPLRISKNRVQLDTVPLNLAAEVDVASAATASIGSTAVASNNIRITGTTTITSFGTADAGITRTLRFAGILTLTHNATSLILPGGANITTAANDTAEFLSLGSGNWFCRAYNAAAGTSPWAIPTNTYTVGAGGKYAATEAGLQAAINDILALPQFTSVALTGTVTRTLNSKTVTGVGTAFLTEMTSLGLKHIAFGTAGKFYPVKVISSDIKVLTVSPMREATTAGMTAYAGTPNVRVIEITEDISFTDVYVNSLGTSLGTWIDAACIAFRFRNGAQIHGRINTKIRSGTMSFDGLRQVDGDGVYIVPGTDVGEEYTSTDWMFNDVFVRNVGKAYPSTFEHYFFGTGFGSGNCRVYLRNAFIESYENCFRPEVDGEFHCYNSTLRVYARTEANPSVLSDHTPLGYLFSDNYAQAFIRDTTFSTQINRGGNYTATGLNLGGLNVIDFVTPPTYCEVHLDNVNIIGEYVQGSIVSTNPNVWITLEFLLNNSKIYFNNVKHRFVGVTSILSNWKSIISSDTAVPTATNEFYFKDTQLGKMKSVHTWVTIRELTGDQGTQAITAVTGTLDTNEIDPLRGSVFTVGPMTGNVAVPAPIAVGPAGHRMRFIITEDGTAGHTVTWNAAFKFGALAWANSTVTTDANKVSNVEFESNGTSYYRVSPQNEWI